MQAPKAEDEQVIEVWPEHHLLWDVFRSLETQWRISEGMAGARAIGLDYSGVKAVMAMTGIKKRQRSQLFSMVREMEIHVLNIYAEAANRVQ